MTATEFATPQAARYSDRLAAATPTPGGGSASAVTGVLAASLVEMVLGISAEKRGGSDAPSAAHLEAKRLRASLLELGSADESAYAGYMGALRLPKSTDEEKSARKQALASATVTAARVPLAIAEECLNLLGLLGDAATQSLPTLLSDLQTAAHLAHGAARGALVMVNVNLASMKQSETRQELAADYDRLGEALPAALTTALSLTAEPANSIV